MTRFLSGRDYTFRDLWLQVKTMVREVHTAEGVLIFDDPIQEKAWQFRFVRMDSGFAPATAANLWQCRACGHPFLRYTEYGGYYEGRRIRDLNPALIV